MNTVYNGYICLYCLKFERYCNKEADWVVSVDNNSTNQHILSWQKTVVMIVPVASKCWKT